MRHQPIPFLLLFLMAPLPALAAATDPGLVGGQLILAGPDSHFGAAFGYQALPFLEVQLGVGTQSAAASATSGGATASASAGLWTPFTRARLWPFGNHNPILEAGLGATIYEFDANGTNTVGDTVTYKRTATLPLAFAGGGYGWRANSGFRLTVLMGIMKFMGSASTSSVTTTGNFDAQDRDDLHKKLDEQTDKLAETRPYVELSLGWMF